MLAPIDAFCLKIEIASDWRARKPIADWETAAGKGDRPVLGPTCVGKSFVASALANAAIRHRFRALLVGVAVHGWADGAGVGSAGAASPLGVFAQSSSSNVRLSGRVLIIRA